VLVDEAGFGAGRQRDAFEDRLGDDDGVPLPHCGAGDEPFAAVGALFGFGREQHFGGRVEAAPLGAELLEHVVGDDDHRLVGHAEAA
jgi:hypothetical protein